jgi:hypothetical protein
MNNAQVINLIRRNPYIQNRTRRIIETATQQAKQSIQHNKQRDIHGIDINTLNMVQVNGVYRTSNSQTVIVQPDIAIVQGIK